MKDFKTTEDLRQYLLSIPNEFNDEIVGASGACYSMSWKKDHWIARVNNKKIGILTLEDITAENINIRDNDFVLQMTNMLRMCNGSLEKMKLILKEKNENY